MNESSPTPAAHKSQPLDLPSILKQERGYYLAGAIVWMLVTNIPRAGSSVDWYAAFLGISLFTIYLVSLKWIHPRIILHFSIWLLLASLVFVENLIRGEASLWYNAGGVVLMIFSSLVKFGQYRRLRTISSPEAVPPSMSNRVAGGD